MRELERSHEVPKIFKEFLRVLRVLIYLAGWLVGLAYLTGWLGGRLAYFTSLKSFTTFKIFKTLKLSQLTILRVLKSVKRS